MEDNLKFIERYFEYRNLGKSMEKQAWVWIRDGANAIDYSYIEQILIDFWSLSRRPVWNNENAVDYFSNSDVFQSRLEVKYQVSNDTGQNILYSIAKEFHGYFWNNNHLDIINFYNAGNQDSTWIYYDNWWRINQDLDWTQKFMYIATLRYTHMVIDWLDLRFDFRDVDKRNMTADQVYNKIIEGQWNWEWLDSSIEAADEKIIQEFKIKTKSIIEREIWYRDQKEVYEKKLIDFVKTQCSDREWYVEIPYDLIIECKKAKIWDVENYLFKIENWEIIALSTWASVGQTLNFDKTKQDIKYEALIPLREELTPEEKAIIDKVWMAHSRLEDIRSLESGWWEFFNTHRDELWIPIALEKEMSNKWIERQKIEKSLLYLSPASTQSYLKENWESYYSYFEDTYLWMMATISQFTRGDDLGNVDHMNKVRSWIGKDIIEVKDNAITISEWISLEDDEKYYILKYTKEIKDKATNKTAEQFLLATKNNTQTSMTVEQQHEKWKWMVKQILISILEAETIKFNDDWSPKRIWCNVDSKDETITDSKMWYWQEPHIDPETWQTYGERYRVDVKPNTKSTKTMEDRINFHLWAGSIVSLSQWLENIDINSLKTKEQTIRKVSKSEESVYDKIDEITKNIISTMGKIDRAGRRWDPKFTTYEDRVENWKIVGKFESRWTSLDIVVSDQNNIVIKWLDLRFDNIQDWLRMANFMNRVNWYYLKKNPHTKWKFDFWDITGKLYVDDSYFNDTDILNSDTIKKYYPKILEDSSKNKILSYLNSLQ
jgi:hypothetical protein